MAIHPKHKISSILNFLNLFRGTLCFRRRLLRSLMNVRSSRPLRKDFVTMQNELLSEEREEKVGGRGCRTAGDRSLPSNCHLAGGHYPSESRHHCQCSQLRPVGLLCALPRLHRQRHPFGAAELQLREACRAPMSAQGYPEPNGRATVLYVFMLLTANIVAETYRSGAIKNIIGRGIAKKQYYLSIVFLVSAAYLLVMLAGSVVMGILVGSKFGMGGVPYPAYYALAVIARILFAIAHISFALTTTIYTRNAITGTVFGFVIPNIPKILEMILGFFRIPIDLGFIKISTYMPSGYSASNDLSSFLPCFAVLCGYLIVSVFAGLGLLNRQDVK